MLFANQLTIRMISAMTRRKTKRTPRMMACVLVILKSEAAEPRLRYAVSIMGTAFFADTGGGVSFRR